MATNDTPPRESVLRDKLAANLDILEPGLVLIGVEHSLPNPDGAAGFIDILVSDRRNDLVIIELKRADQTARQALHELEKYVALLSQQNGLRVDQLRALLVSTTWHELRVPFSRYLSHVDFYLEGLHLQLDEAGAPIRADRVSPVALSRGVELCPMYFGMLFESKQARESAVQSTLGLLDDSDLNDFVLIKVNSSQSDVRIIYPYALYVVFAEFSPAMRAHIERNFPDEDYEDYEPDDYWHEQVVQAHLAEHISCDEVANNSPASPGPLENWSLVSAFGSGVFGQKAVWDENRLLHLVLGSRERHAMSFSDSVTPANKPAWRRMVENTASVLSAFGDWSAAVQSWLLEAETEGDTVEIQIYAPAIILFGLESLARSGDDSHLPEISLLRRGSSATTALQGRLTWDGRVRQLSIIQVLEAAGLDLDFLSAIAAETSGAGGLIETPLLAAMGLQRGLFEVVIDTDTGTAHSYALQIGDDGLLERCDLGPVIQEVQDFADAHPVFIRELLSEFDSHVFGR